MPRINIYEHSDTYSFQVRNNNYATVALPIAAIWGPSFVEGDEENNPDWVHFSAGYRGTTDFIQTFRGANTYLGAREKSYDYCLKLLSAGYDILVKRVDGLGDKARYTAVVPAIGSTDLPAPGKMQLLFQQPIDSSASLTRTTVCYQFYDPILQDVEETKEIVWTDSDTEPTKLKITQKIFNKITNQWDSVASSSRLVVETKDMSDTPYIVRFRRPTVDQLSSDAIINSNEQVAIRDGEAGDPETIVYGPVAGKKRVVSGTIEVSVEDLKGTVLETKTIRIAEEYLGYGKTGRYLGLDDQHEPQWDETVNDEIKITSISMPEFTYIRILAIPPMLLFKPDTADGWDGAFYLNCKNSGTSQDPEYDQVYPNSNPISIAGTPETSSPRIVAGSGEGNQSMIFSEHIPSNSAILDIVAKYAGSFGNNLKVRIRCSTNAAGLRIGTIEVYNTNGHTAYPNQVVPTDQLLEIVSVAFDEDAATDSQPIVSEAVFNNLSSITPDGSDLPVGEYIYSLYRGTDNSIYDTEGASITPETIVNLVKERFTNPNSTYVQYIQSVASSMDSASLIRLYNQQMLYKRFLTCVSELTDPFVYDWDALFCGIADDQYVPKSYFAANPEFSMEYEVTSIMTKMVEVAANSKCGCAFIGTPFGMPRGIQVGSGDTAVRTGALKFKDDLSSAMGTVYSTFGEVVGPWCKTTLALSGANSWICPELAHLLLIINAQGIGGQNKWWMIPAGMLGSGVVHTPEYKIKKAYLDLIQDHDEGVCLNPLMEVPGKGFTCFGNSTLWDKPLGTYNALQNLSTRLLTNRVKQRIWDTALQILFKYNNEDAYSHFYAGLSPLLDEMRSVGALTGNEYNPWGYRIIMNPDIINLDRINANTVIGRVELAVTGVIDTVDVDLFLLPPTGFQETYD